MFFALTLVIAGLILNFAAFRFGASNRFRETTSISGFDSLFTGQIVAVIVMTFGGLMFIIGLILAGVNILNRVFP